MIQEKRLFANPMTVYREEADAWAMLFNLETGKSFVLNPVGVFIWQCLDGRHNSKEIAQKLKINCDAVPEDVEAHIQEFIDDLMKKGMAVYEFSL